MFSCGSRYDFSIVKKTISLSRNSQLPFSDAVLVDGTLYLSGRIGFLPGTRVVPQDPAEEAKLVLDGVREVLAAAEMTMDDLAHVQIFTPDVSLFDSFNAVYKTYFTGELPARAFIGSGPSYLRRSVRIGCRRKAGLIFTPAQWTLNPNYVSR
jgi:2-iminobutanoate/2-iminopropanoate deaminase